MKQEPVAREFSWSNERLVGECRKGNQVAWSALIEKYKNLIFSIPIKSGISREDAADIFQSVCVDLLSDLSQLREPEALPKWLMQVSYHKCLHWKKQQWNLLGDAEVEQKTKPNSDELPEEIFFQVQREQKLRDTMAGLSPRCSQMIGMLFFENPPRPYEEVAKTLGLATGSIGFIRGRCLKLLRDRLKKEGF